MYKYTENENKFLNKVRQLPRPMLRVYCYLRSDMQTGIESGEISSPEMLVKSYSDEDFLIDFYELDDNCFDEHGVNVYLAAKDILSNMENWINSLFAA